MIPAQPELPDDVDALKAMILAMSGNARQAQVLAAEKLALEAEIAELKALNATADERIARLTLIIKTFQRTQFGKRSEKRDADALSDEQYGLVFDELKTGLAAIQAQLDKTKGPSRDKRAARPRKGFAPHLERVEVVIEPEDLPEHQGRPKVFIGEDVCQSARNFGCDSISMKFGAVLVLFSQRNQHYGTKLSHFVFDPARFCR